MKRLRKIAWHIRDVRAYLTFDSHDPDFSSYTTKRGSIPWHLWRSDEWKNRHIVMPAIRERLKWPYQRILVPGSLPFGVDFIQEAVAPLLQEMTDSLRREELAVAREKYSRRHIQFRNARYRKK